MEGEKSFFLPVPAVCDGLRADEALQALLGMSNRQIRTLKRTKGHLPGWLRPVYAQLRRARGPGARRGLREPV